MRDNQEKNLCLLMREKVIAKCKLFVRSVPSSIDQSLGRFSSINKTKYKKSSYLIDKLIPVAGKNVHCTFASAICANIKYNIILKIHLKNRYRNSIMPIFFGLFYLSFASCLLSLVLHLEEEITIYLTIHLHKMMIIIYKIFKNSILKVLLKNTIIYIL